MHATTTRPGRRSRLKTTLLGLVALLLVLAAVLVGRALAFRPETVAVTPVQNVQVDANAAAERLGQAIRIRTISHQDAAQTDSSAFRALHALLEQAFPRVHATLRRETVSDLSLLYTWPGRDPSQPPVVLMAHQDVVPVDEGTEAAWTHDAFSGTVQDGFIWGRGAIDDKSGVLGILEAVELLLADGFVPERTVYLAFGHDEEAGGKQGARMIATRLAEQGVRPALVLDEGGAIMDGVVMDLEPPVALVGVAEKGYTSLELSVETAGGHSSRPPEETSIGILSRALTRLQDRPFPARLDGATAEMFGRVGPHLPFGRRLVFANRWLFDPLLLRILTSDPSTAAVVRTTIAPTIFRSGVRDNVLPVRASAVVNFRVLPGETLADVEAHVRAAIDDPRITIRPFGDQVEPSPVSPGDSEAFRVLERSIREVYPSDDLIVSPYLVVGGTDAKHFAALSDNVYRFAATTLRPEDLDRFHGTDERIAVDDYARMIRFFYQLLRNTNSL